MPGWIDEGRKLVQEPEMEAMLKRVFSDSPLPRRLLNAGAGEGLYSHVLDRIPGRASIVEFDVSYARWTRRPRYPRQWIAAASLTAIPFAAARFDLILCSEVLEHVAEDREALDELVRVLAPRGWLLISVPTPPAVFDRAHVREGYTPATLTGLLKERGLEVVAIRYCMYRVFQFFLRTHRAGVTPKMWVWLASWLDRRTRAGSAMDILILAQRGA
jgi:SAM-dependent methyltransferase